jgi:pimeloyl-ACP methyl ester carboxylesterase
VALEYHREGRGEPLLLLHGIGCHWPVWEPLLPALTAGRDVIAVDLPGFGSSAPLPGGEAPTVARQADAVAQLASALGLDRPHVAGNSMGGGIALELGRTGRARSVTALSPIGFWRGRDRAYARGVIAATARLAPFLAPLAPGITSTATGRVLSLGHMSARPWRWPAEAATDLYRAAAASPVFLETLDAIIRWDWSGGGLPVPATIAWAEHDRLLIPRQRLRAAKALPNAKHLVLEGCGHLPFYDDPDQVARVVLEGSAGS